MGVIAKGIPRGYQGLFTPVSLGYPLSVFNKNSTLNDKLAICTRSAHVPLVKTRSVLDLKVLGEMLSTSRTFKLVWKIGSQNQYIKSSVFN